MLMLPIDSTLITWQLPERPLDVQMLGVPRSGKAAYLAALYDSTSFEVVAGIGSGKPSRGYASLLAQRRRVPRGRGRS